MEQRSPEWYQERLGKVTASRIADVLAKGRSGPSATRANYRAQLVAERLTGVIQEDGFTSAAMQRGNEVEAEARAAYAFYRDAEILKASFVPHPTIEMAGASPDGFVWDDGLVEIKCPNTATHIATIRGKSIQGGYQKQILWQMACTGREWCDFVSYDPRLPGKLAMHVERIFRDDKAIAEVEAQVKVFLQEVEDEVTHLQTLVHAETAKDMMARAMMPVV